MRVHGQGLEINAPEPTGFYSWEMIDTVYVEERTIPPHGRTSGRHMIDSKVMAIELSNGETVWFADAYMSDDSPSVATVAREIRHAMMPEGSLGRERLEIGR